MTMLNDTDDLVCEVIAAWLLKERADRIWRNVREHVANALGDSVADLEPLYTEQKVYLTGTRLQCPVTVKPIWDQESLRALYESSELIRKSGVIGASWLYVRGHILEAGLRVVSEDEYRRALSMIMDCRDRVAVYPRGGPALVSVADDNLVMSLVRAKERTLWQDGQELRLS